MTMTTWLKTMISTEADIEAIWGELALPDLAEASEGIHRRLAPDHPLDIYVGLRDGGQATFLLVSPVRPPSFRELRSVSIEVRKRQDGRYTLLLALEDPSLRPIFAGLCADLVNATRQGVPAEKGPSALLARLGRWWHLLEGARAGLSRSVLLGLMGELLVLKYRLIPALGCDAAVASWKGPDGADQDFRLPGGLRWEVKAASAGGTTVQINGLGQLDGEGDALELLVVRLVETSASATDALTPASLVTNLRGRLGSHPSARAEFDSLLAAVGWHEHPSHHDLAVRCLGLERHQVDDSFPCLNRATVPTSVTEARYSILLPEARLEPIEATGNATSTGEVIA